MEFCILSEFVQGIDYGRKKVDRVCVYMRDGRGSGNSNSLAYTRSEVRLEKMKLVG